MPVGFRAVGVAHAIDPDYGSEGLPTVAIIAPDGTVRFRTSGFSKPEVIARIDALLTEFSRSVPASGSRSDTP